MSHMPDRDLELPIMVDRTASNRPVIMSLSPRQHEAAINYLQEAIELIPAEERLAYGLALRLAPALIESESNPLLFMRHEGFNPFSAARRLVKYWELRYETFGPERAFRSIFDLSGQGALPPVTVEYSRCGLLTILPPDDKGRPVFFLDRSKIPTELMHLKNEIRFQCSFYALSLLMQTGARDFLVIVFFHSRPRFFPASGSWFLEAVENAFPLGLDTILVACRSPRSFYKQFMATYVPVILKIASRSQSRIQIAVDVGETEDILKKLIQHGLNPDHLPESVGGSWTGSIRDDIAQTRKLRIAPTHAQEITVDESLAGLDLLVAVVDLEEIFSDPNCMLKKPNDGSAELKGNGATVGPTEPQSDTNVPESAPVAPIAPTVAPALPLSIDEALAAIPQPDKAAYLEVMAIAPHLVQQESSLDEFVALENGDLVQAAKRVVSYWALRRDLFRDRAYLPLNLSGGKKKLVCAVETNLPLAQAGF
jgi:hypothetical protein